MKSKEASSGMLQPKVPLVLFLAITFAVTKAQEKSWIRISLDERFCLTAELADFLHQPVPHSRFSAVSYNRFNAQLLASVLIWKQALAPFNQYICSFQMES